MRQLRLSAGFLARPRVISTLLAFALGLTLAPAPGEVAEGVPGRVKVFGGLGAWIDIYDDAQWEDPEGTVLAMQAYGVRTLYLETCNYGCKEDLHRPTTLARWIDAAHAAGMRIVAWYLPGFDDLALDERRSLAAMSFRSPSGQGFDGFALDIEARVVTPVKKRNARIVELSRRLRAAAGARYPMAAITIPWFYEWGGPFPYRGLDPHYDVFMPMIYFTARASSAKGARFHTAQNIQEIRDATGNQKTRVHAIGGIADEMNERETAAFVNAAKRRHVIGASLYDYATSGPEDWEKLALLGP